MSTTTLEWKATVHDQSQLEITVDYLLPRHTTPSSGGRRKERPQFQLEVYFFTPKSLGLNSQTYSRESFYKDLTNFIRVHTPDRRTLGGCHLPGLDAWMELERTESCLSTEKDRAIHEVKLFGNLINLQIKNLFKGSTSIQETLGQEILDCIHSFRNRYLKPVLEKFSYDEPLKTALIWVDEYLSNRFESALSQLPLHEYPTIREILEAERKHKKAMGYKNANRNASARELEAFYHRHGVLKKFVSEILYLKTEEVKRDRIYRNIMAAFGAALAGLWAELARMDSNFTNGARDFGLQFFVFASIGVLIYVFKDRIKDMSKEYFNEKMKSYLPDYEVALSYGFFDTQGLKNHLQLGKYHENVRYLSSSSLPDEVKFLRELAKKGDLSEEVSENAIHYSKQLWLNQNAPRSMNVEHLALKDVFRFNTSEFLHYFDNPEKSLSIYDLEEGSIKVRAPKVYYFHIFLRMTNANRIQVEHLRLVLNKAGIVRIDPIYPPGEHWYAEELK